MSGILDEHDPVLFGENPEEGLVAAGFREGSDGDTVELFFRKGESLDGRKEKLTPFVLAESGLFDDYDQPFEIRPLDGSGRLNECVFFPDWKSCSKAKSWAAKVTGISPSAFGAPYLFFSDPVQQHLTVTGLTFFKGMEYESLRRLQLDIECTTAEGYEFCNAQRKEDRIIAIALGMPDGEVKVLSGAEMDEKTLLQEFVRVVREADPDIIEGHNIFNFDLPYITSRAKRHKVKLELGRDGSVPSVRPSRFNAAERTISYKRYDIFGRSIVDTLFLLHIYDISHRTLNGYGLKEAAVHFGFASDNRTYIEGSQIAEEFRRNPDLVMEYVKDDIQETASLGSLLSRSSFIQAMMLPYSYQNVMVRGNATKINALMIREYLRRGRAVPLPGEPSEFAGGYTDMFETGVINDVHHCDVRSLYPSLMLSRKLGPGNDNLGVFLEMLEKLRDFRLESKKKMQDSSDDRQRNHYDALQTAFKVLINSFYGYLGFTQGNFNDFASAEQVTAQGRELLRQMIDWLRQHGAKPIEIDTDGIYFVPPEHSKGEGSMKKFRGAFQESLPDGIEVEFDGEYLSMYSYKMKNYALLDSNGEVVIKGGALKSRGLEPFQRSFLQEFIRLKLEGRGTEVPALKARYEDDIRSRSLPLSDLAKTETLQDSPATYQTKRDGAKKTPRRAAYELALGSERDYRAGDQVSYYVTGDRKTVTVYEAARLVSEWDGTSRDENVPYYIGKLDALYKKFGAEEEASLQGELF